MKRPLHHLVLPFGLVLAIATFAYWTVLGYVRFNEWTQEGLFRAVFVLGAVLLLSGVLRLVRWITERGGL
ncbi:MAG: hypothetical protein IIC18_11270 [Bacteroidetes bacterium]|nr:hypothetical protein [Bacteroidota bacterium]MCH8030454.1 hypothetical protein [Bacteroidota bacterium]